LKKLKNQLKSYNSLMKNYIFLFLFIHIILIFQSSKGQWINNNQYPRIKWLELKSNHYRIMHPKGLYEQALKISKIIEKKHSSILFQSDTLQSKWPIVLNPLVSNYNGYVSIAPKKSELYLCPPITNINREFNGEWLETLIIHEMRHISQFNYLNRNFTKFLSRIFGDGGWALGLAFSAPPWFYEGDAVYIETLFSKTGRGRAFSFTSPIKTLICNNEMPDYHIALLGSYNSIYPHYYDLGYYFVIYFRKKYGYEIFNQILLESSKHSYNPYAFQNSVKKTTGISIETHYDIMVNEFKTTFESIHKQFMNTPVQNIKTKHSENDYTEYLYPQKYEDKIICIKYGSGFAPAIISIDQLGRENVLKQIKYPVPFTISQTHLYFSQPMPDIRYQQESFSDIFSLNLKTKKTNRLTYKKKYFQPSISDDGQKLLCLKKNDLLGTDIILFEKKKENNNDNAYKICISTASCIKNPVWYKYSNKFSYILEYSDISEIREYNIETGQDILVYQSKGFPIYSLCYINNDYIINSNFSGIDGIYHLNRNSNKISLITHSFYGDYYPFYDFNVNGLIFNRLSSNGLIIKKIDNIINQKKEFEYQKPYHIFDQASYQNTNSVIDTNYLIKKNHFSCKKNLLNFHSRYYMPINQYHYLGFLTNNILNTLTGEVGILYNEQTKKISFRTEITYSGFFPLISAYLESGNKSNSYYTNNDKIKDQWNENNLGLQIELPLKMDNINNYQWLNFFTKFDYKETLHLNQSNYQYYYDYYRMNGILYSLTYGISFRRIKPTCKKDISIRKGLYTFFSYSHTPIKKLNPEYNGSKISLLSGFYTPGFFSHDAFEYYIYYEKRKFNSYLFPSSFQFVSGWERIYFQDYLQSRVKYSFPFAYPEKSLKSIFYLKRIHSNIFIEHGVGRNPQQFFLKEKSFTTIGLDMIFNYHCFDLPHVEISSGFRLNFLYQRKSYNIQALIFNIIF